MDPFDRQMEVAQHQYDMQDDSDDLEDDDVQSDSYNPWEHIEEGERRGN